MLYVFWFDAHFQAFFSRSAVKLLSYLGPSVILRSEHLDTIYKLLERRLSDDPIIEVRYQMGITMRELKLFDRVYQRMTKNLESTDSDTRAHAVVALVIYINWDFNIFDLIFLKLNKKTLLIFTFDLIWQAKIKCRK